MPDSQCPICSRALTNTPVYISSMMMSYLYNCPQCGQFIFDSHTSQVSGFSDSKQLTSAWIRRQNKLGNDSPIVAKGDTTGIWFQSLQRMGFPQTVNDKLDELLKAYAQIVKDDYLMVVKTNQYPTLISDIAGKNYEEIKGLNKLLIERRYPRASPWHFINQASLDLNPGAPGTQHTSVSSLLLSRL